VGRYRWVLIAGAVAAVAFLIWKSRASSVIVGYITHRGKSLPVVKAAGSVGL
jgi:pheromone shutdown protein TraB